MGLFVALGRIATQVQVAVCVNPISLEIPIISACHQLRNQFAALNVEQMHTVNMVFWEVSAFAIPEVMVILMKVVDSRNKRFALKQHVDAGLNADLV